MSGDALKLTVAGSEGTRFGGVTESGIVAVLHRLIRTRKGAAGLTILLLLLIVALFAPYLARYNPNENHLAAQLAPPSAIYWFGTDELGRDIFSRVIYGSRPSLLAGLLTVFLAAVVGSLTGVLGGYYRGWFDLAVMRVWDTLLAFPAIFLAIGIVSILGPGWINGTLAITIVNIPVFARLVRAVTISVVEKDFIVSARAIGCSDWQVMLTHVFPNCLAPLIVQMAIAAPDAILVEAALSFLGLGSQPPDPSWGNMLSSAQGYIYRSATYALFPGLAITLVVLGMNFFADGLQDAIDPRRIRGRE
ncbi:MAG TPA: ABC transporter permease [Chloroflexota bacterium]|nr:ABC transporter permease [Chloroflexota bacterium]